jgi:ribosome-associated translation inhibitor RaiA
MQVQVNTDAHIEGREALLRWVEAEVGDKLGRFRDSVTRVEVHLSDDNGGKPGASDKRCMMEVRLAGHPPLAVKHHAATLADAFGGATEKLKHSLDTALERQRDRNGRDSIRSDAHTPSDPDAEASLPPLSR